MSPVILCVIIPAFYDYFCNVTVMMFFIIHRVTNMAWLTLNNHYTIKIN